MMREYTVGRSTLREALRLLEVQGLLWVKSGPGGGPVLAQLDASDFARMARFYVQAAHGTYLEMLQARLIFEPILARVVAQAQHRERIDRLLSIATAVSNVASVTESVCQENFRCFHAELATMSGNIFIDLVGGAMREIFSARREASTPLSLRIAVWQEHLRIAAAIDAADGVSAERLMYDHIRPWAMQSAALYGLKLEAPVTWSDQ